VEAGRGGAAATTWIFRGRESVLRWRRGHDVDISWPSPRRRISARPRVRVLLSSYVRQPRRVRLARAFVVDEPSRAAADWGRADDRADEADARGVVARGEDHVQGRVARRGTREGAALEKPRIGRRRREPTKLPERLARGPRHEKQNERHEPHSHAPTGAAPRAWEPSDRQVETIVCAVHRPSTLAYHGFAAGRGCGARLAAGARGRNGTARAGRNAGLGWCQKRRPPHSLLNPLPQCC